ncbi:MAG: endonuclease YncB(thermonuclease family) [Kiritimatiellia bacterium]|jgi:endonuclease YncB( thermonuclease family)
MRTDLLLLLLTGLACQADDEKNWKTFEHCTLIENDSNDGDSFHVKYNKRSYIFRLYWTDAPETDNRYPDRVHEQAEYFGIDDTAALRIGKDAAHFSREKLKEPFTVFTTYEDARGASDKKRYYAMIKVGDTFLSESLVEAGLVRLKGFRPNPPGAVSDRTFTTRLMGLEKTARKEGRGGWATTKTDAPSPVPAETNPATEAGVITTGHRLLRQALIFSAAAPHSPIGTLQKGHAVEVLGKAHANLVKVRFLLPSGKIVAGLCEKTYLTDAQP